MVWSLLSWKRSRSSRRASDRRASECRRVCNKRNSALLGCAACAILTRAVQIILAFLGIILLRSFYGGDRCQEAGNRGQGTEKCLMPDSQFQILAKEPGERSGPEVGASRSQIPNSKFWIHDFQWRAGNNAENSEHYQTNPVDPLFSTKLCEINPKQSDFRR